MMEVNKKNQKTSLEKKSLFLMLLCWLIYTSSYIGRFSYSSNINTIRSAFDVSYGEAGLVTTCFFFVYGAGQIINGIFCKRYNIKYVIFASLLVSSLMNLGIILVPKFAYMKFIWLINGIAMSFLWTSLIRLLSETISKEEIGKAIVIMGTTVASGTFVIYGLSALFVAILSYKFVFITTSSLLFIVAIIWFSSFNKLVNPLKEEREKEKVETSFSKEVIVKKSGGNGVALLICILAFFAVANNFVKDGLTTWTPDILAKLYNTPAWLSILLTLLLPFMAIFGAISAVTIQKIIKNFIGTCLFLFGVATVLLGAVIGTLSANVMVLTIACFALVSCLMAGVNNVITSMVPLSLKDKVNSGKLAGILDGFCYLGSTISSYGLGAIADNFTWTNVFNVLLYVSIFVVMLGGIYLLINKIKKAKETF